MLHMRVWTTYTHPGLLDLTMQITKIQYRGSKVLKLKVNWLTKKGAFFCADKVTVQIKDLKNWKVYEPI